MDNAKYYNLNLWAYYDQYRTTNNMNVSLNITKDNYGFSVPRVSLRISNYRNRTNSSISVSYSMLYKYLKDINKIPILHGGNKVAFRTIKMSTKEYGNETQLLAISERGSDYLDSEKIFLPPEEFESLIEMLLLIKVNYSVLTSTLCNQAYFEDIKDSIDHNTSKLNDLYRVSIVGTGTISEIPDEHEISFGEEEHIDTEEQKSFDTFMNNNFEKAEIPDALGEQIQREAKKEEVVEKLLEDLNDDFTKYVVENDIKNLDMLCKSVVQEQIPIVKFIDIIKEKLGRNDIIENSDPNLLYYVSTLYLKEPVRRMLQKKVPLPQNVSPFKCDISKVCNSKNISLLYSMYSLHLLYLM